jgi:glycerol-3-phosphate dehydrogenase subunit C
MSGWSSDLLQDEVAESADRCIKCNMCNTACPVMPATDLFPGPKYCGPQLQRFRAGDPVEEWVDYCSGCGACTRACPTGVMVAELNARARARIYERRGVPLRNRLISSSELLGRLGAPVAPLANRVLASPGARALAERMLGIAKEAPLPRFSRQGVRAALAQVPQPGTDERVAYFHGCATGYYEPWVGVAAVRVLNRHGIRVEVPEQSCCGLPFLSNGDFRTGRRYAQRLVRQLLPAVRAGLPIVATSTSCSFALKSEYEHVLGMHEPEVREVAAATRDLFEFLRERSWSGELELRPAVLHRRILYHGPCQLRSHGIGEPALEVLEGLAGAEVESSRVECCGIAGTYGLKAEKYGIARRVGEALVARAEEVRPDLVACDSETCRWHIAAMTGLPARHPIELLDQAQAALEAP